MNWSEMDCKIKVKEKRLHGKTINSPKGLKTLQIKIRRHNVF
jgi:hypothetical protein